MRFRYLLVLLALCHSCIICSCQEPINYSFGLRPVNGQGENLLLTKYKEGALELFYIEDSKLKLARNRGYKQHQVEFDRDSSAFLLVDLFLPGDSITAILDWGDGDRDTICAIPNRDEDLNISFHRLWYNEEMVSLDTDELYEVVK